MERECRDQVVTLLVPPIAFESRRMLVVMLVPSRGFGSQRMLVMKLIQPKGIESQRMMMMMMSRTVVHTHSWDCDCVDVVSPIILSRRH